MPPFSPHEPLPLLPTGFLPSIMLFLSFVVKIEQDFYLLRKSFEVIVHSGQHDNERNNANTDRPEG